MQHRKRQLIGEMASDGLVIFKRTSGRSEYYFEITSLVNSTCGMSVPMKVRVR
jgi:hypothetical protein